MVTDDGHAKLIDFGLAKLVDREREAATASSTRRGPNPDVILGTAAYMSPEQARGLRVDHRSDIFAFGVTLYEMLTGRAPSRDAEPRHDARDPHPAGTAAPRAWRLVRRTRPPNCSASSRRPRPRTPTIGFRA